MRSTEETQNSNVRFVLAGTKRARSGREEEWRGSECRRWRRGRGVSETREQNRELEEREKAGAAAASPTWR
jgi:hypothetical protein